ncbi:MAG: phosphoenolpyruvate--protein phosphotransferase, partial [Chlamydiia bacterium]|nr:phosphoenolpyruvate--protein phosphotransferase [Chlamydiia bacterium]
GGSGVGLFRSEYIFLSKQCFPSEEEQYLIYSRIVERMKGLPIVIRTFDVGGDKLIVEQQASHKGNPYLGCRAIRFLLKERDIFKAQLRAILRAAENGKVSILFPMVSDLSELMEAKEIIAEVQDELWPGKRKIDPKVRIGCMIEVPSAALIADLLARECDFLAIGTNDLVQYLLAVDRCNQAINKLYTPMHPALIRLIKLVVTQASELNVPVSVCGEIAGDPRFTPLLIGLGVHELSVSLRNYPLIKQAIRRTSIIRAHELADEVVGLTTPDEIREALTREYKRIMPEDCHDLTLN